MALLTICCVALFASLLTFFSGFGLGTILLPAFAIFFPLPQAIAMTAIVHLGNNVFKTGIVFRRADWNIVLRFGVFTIPAAIAGALLLEQAAKIPVLSSYTIFGKEASISWQGILIGLLMIFFAVYEVFPFLENKIRYGKNLWLGGIISGFLGGFSGHQGAIRSAFLLRVLKEKEVYVATGTMIAILVDVSRLGVYSKNLKTLSFEEHWHYLLFPVLAAFAGAVAGNILLKKITLKFVKALVCLLLIVFGLLTLSGILVKN
jgi:uncharacterized protein